jgi:hypothetical protein
MIHSTYVSYCFRSHVFQADLLSVADWQAYQELEAIHTKSDENWPTTNEINQTCDAPHDDLCSLSLPAGAYGWDRIESNISVGDVTFRLPAPPLDLRKVFHNEDGSRFQQRLGQDAYSPADDIWIYNGTVLDNMEVSNSSICVASDQYSWGFSSMLLLTFCIYTLLFSATLILLQAEVYWYSRSDRLDFSSSIYADIVYLADAMRTKFGDGILDIPVKELDKKVRDHRGGIFIDVGTLPCTRILECDSRLQ